MKSIYLPAVVIGCWLALGSGLPVQAASLGSGLGVNVHLLSRFEAVEYASSAQQVSTLGGTWAREQINWNTVEPSDNNFDFSDLDQVMEAYAQTDLHVLGLLTYSADWASSNPTADDAQFYPPAQTSDWLDFVSHVVHRYDGQVHAWEIWNEPNHSGFWKPAPDAADYADFLEATADKIHTIDPDAKVVLGGLSGVDTDFLDQVYQRIGQGKFDVVALHPYREAGGSKNWSPEEALDGLLPLVNELSAARSVMRRHGDGATPIWLTEFGWSTGTGGVTETQQKRYLARQIALALSVPKVKKVFWYAYQDGSTGNSLDDNFGVTKDDGARKPAAKMLSFLQQMVGQASSVKGPLGDLGNTVLAVEATDWEIAQAEHAGGSLSASGESLTMNYVVVDDQNSYITYEQAVTLPANTQSFSFLAQGDNSKNILRFRLVDAAGETFQYTVGSLTSDQLRYQRAVSEWDSYYGGDNDGVLDQPLQFQSFVIDDSPDDVSGTGSITVSGLRAGAHLDFLTKYIQQNSGSAQERYLVWSPSGKHLVGLKLNATKIRYKGLNNSQVFTSTNGVFYLMARPTPKAIVVLE